jgi:hypothetical protein
VACWVRVGPAGATVIVNLREALLHSLLMMILRRRAFSVFGTRTISTPSDSDALTWSSCTSAGSWTR